MCSCACVCVFVYVYKNILQHIHMNVLNLSQNANTGLNYAKKAL
jgi:hypothetical protein